MQSEKPRQGPRADINVTPLVDVCLVLLIIFMVVTPLLKRHATVELPLTPSPGRIEASEEKLLLAMSWPDRAMWYRESWLLEREMLDKLKELRARSESKRLVVIADRRLSYGDVRGLMRLANRAGFPGLELAATKDIR
jgi:biopolymer transport protein TolR